MMGDVAMKKMISFFLSAFLMFSVIATPLCGFNTVLGFTITKDAKTAVEKNKELFLKLWDKEDVTVNYTKAQLEDLAFGACEYSSNEYVGTAFMVENFRVVGPSASKAGSVSADVIFYLDDAEDGFHITKELAPLGGVDDEEDDDTTGGTNTEIDSQTAKKEIEKASSAISAAIFDYEVSNDTTKKDILDMAKKAVGGDSPVKLSINSADFSIVKATTQVNGTLSATVTLECGDQSKRVPVGKTIEPIVTADSIKLEEDRKAISKALDEIVYSNKITKEEMLEVAQSVIKNGTKIEWKDNFYKNKASFKASGEVIGYLIMTYGDETREMRLHREIPRLVHKMPSDKINVNAYEWDVLALSNIERAKVGDQLLSMAGPLQDATEIREKEIGEKYEHTRPDGTRFSTAIADTFKAVGTGENLYRCTPGHMDPDRAVTGWMNSPGHKANILRDNYDYIGVGMDGTHAVQIFAIWNSPIVSFETSAGTFNFADEESLMKEYLICRTADGLETYMPLDIESMTKTDSGYTVKMNSTVPIEFTVGDAASSTVKNNAANNNETKDNTSVNPSTSFADVKADAYYANAVKWAVDKNITTGTSKTTFSPNDTCTRAQILTFLWRAVGSPEATSNNPFGDVSKDDYYYNAAVWASEKGMVAGSKFNADTPCTRSSTVMYMWKNAGAPEFETSNKFSDVSQSSEYAQAVAWALENNVTSGTSDTEFSPNEICSRGQIVTFLNRAIK